MPHVVVPDPALRRMCNQLGKNVSPDSSQTDLDDGFRLVWTSVSDALKESELPKSLITKFNQFEANVNRKGRSEFYELLRGIATTNSWSDLLTNGMYLNLIIAKHPVTASCADVFFEKPCSPEPMGTSYSCMTP